jgi:uncharacterized protein (TIGR03435 family)
MKMVIIEAILAITIGVAQAQNQSRPRFDVSVVKPMNLGVDYSSARWSCEGGHLLSTGVALRYLIARAYEIIWPFSLPDWAEGAGTRYYLAGKTDNPLSEQDCWLATQNLLEDRFKLKLHRELREVPAYDLLLSKGGTKLHEPKLDQPIDGVWLRGNQFSRGRWTSEVIAVRLGNLPVIGRPIVDKTGLKGQYEFRLDYAARPDEDKPDIFTALQEQLGLKLEPSKASVEFVVIDNIKKPSLEN